MSDEKNKKKKGAFGFVLTTKATSNGERKSNHFKVTHTHSHSITLQLY